MLVYATTTSNKNNSPHAFSRTSNLSSRSPPLSLDTTLHAIDNVSLGLPAQSRDTTRTYNHTTQYNPDPAATRETAPTNRNPRHRYPRESLQYFRLETTSRLMILCDVIVESDLTEVWSKLASNGGKRDRQIIEMVFTEKAAEFRMKSSTPIVTPNLAKKITELRLVGTSLDALDEGVSLFSIVLVENATRSGETTYQAALKTARNCDDLTKCVSMPQEEFNTLQTTKINVPTHSQQ